ncbi:MAG: DUF1772 domain-containing protein [Acidimicrobiales bacterium]
MKRFVHQSLAVVGSAMFTGVMLTIGLALGRYWLDLEPQEFAVWFEANFILLLPCVVVTLVPAFIGVGWLLKRDWDVPRLRRGWLIAFAGLGIASAITAVYHLPANFRLWGLDQTDAEVTSELRWWLIMHVPRTLAGLVGAVAALWTALESAQALPSPAAHEREPTATSGLTGGASR